MNYPDNPRYAPPTQAELEEMFAEPTPADSLDGCVHGSACVRALGLLLYGGEVDTNMVECAKTLGCAMCDEWERK